MTSDFIQQIQQRRTFAIISHPHSWLNVSESRNKKGHML